MILLFSCFGFKLETCCLASPQYFVTRARVHQSYECVILFCWSEELHLLISVICSEIVTIWQAFISFGSADEFTLKINSYYCSAEMCYRYQRRYSPEGFNFFFDISSMPCQISLFQLLSMICWKKDRNVKPNIGA